MQRRSERSEAERESSDWQAQWHAQSKRSIAAAREQRNQADAIHASRVCVRYSSQRDDTPARSRRRQRGSHSAEPTKHIDSRQRQLQHAIKR